MTGVQTCALPILTVWQLFTVSDNETASKIRRNQKIVLKIKKGSRTRSEERRVGKSVDLGGRRIIKKKTNIKKKKKYFF